LKDLASDLLSPYFSLLPLYLLAPGVGRPKFREKVLLYRKLCYYAADERIRRQERNFGGFSPSQGTPKINFLTEAIAISESTGGNMSDKDDKWKSEMVKREENIPSARQCKGIPIDFTGMTESQIQALKEQHAKRMIEIATKAVESGVDNETLDKKLSTIAGHTISLAKAGASVTITSASDDSIGRTEIMIGNTEAAKEGKLSRSQAGLKDLYPIWIGVGIFIIIVIAIIAKMR
jgi:hypothetical protein